MARKSLSSQVLEELDRAGGLLRSVADSVDPIIGHLLGEVQRSHQRIETMCLAARQQTVNAVTEDRPGTEETTEVPKATRTRGGAHKASAAPRARKAAAK
ncbi:MAG TPA: hypothetical protein VGH54_29645 [Mycobacterium sp.]|jgi:hypothetical protein|uniref:hypothetical protein n=1 Tax=Mycobacterium sp. TaxID=1785 RepID=UPI002F3F8A81